MRCIYGEKVIRRMLAVQVLRTVWPGVVWSPLSHVRRVNIPEPPLPGPRWVRLRNRQCGMCHSDLGLLYAKVMPAVAPAALPGNERIYFGHEVVSDVVEVGPGVRGLQVGDRVVMRGGDASPSCLSQEIDPPCRSCARGQTQLCENASLGRGVPRVGGGWSEGYLSHESEVQAIPDDLSDDQAVLIEPASVALHAVLRRPPAAGDHALVIGAGTIGLLTLQAVRAVAPDCHVTVMARHAHQASAARSLGAHEVVVDGDVYSELARVTGAKAYRAPLNRGMLLGGFERVYDCVGSQDTLTDALRWARAGGAVVMVGYSLDFLKVDLNPVWYQEVDLIGSYVYGREDWQGRHAHTYDFVIELMRRGAIRADDLISHRFPVRDLPRAVATAIDKRSGAIKVVLMISPAVQG